MVNKVFFCISFLRNDMRENCMNSIINLRKKLKDVQFIALFLCKEILLSLIHMIKKSSNLGNSGKDAKCDMHVYFHSGKEMIGIIILQYLGIQYFSIFLNE